MLYREMMLDMVRRVPGRDSSHASALWSWTYNSDERAAISGLPGVASVCDLNPPIALCTASLALILVRRLPRRVRYALPVFPVVEITFS